MIDSYHKNIYSKWLEQNRLPASQKAKKSQGGQLQVRESPDSDLGNQPSEKLGNIKTL